MIRLTSEEFEAHESVTKCFLCHQILTDKRREKGFIDIQIFERCDSKETANIAFP
jgi:hypothetical protein